MMRSSFPPATPPGYQDSEEVAAGDNESGLFCLSSYKIKPALLVVLKRNKYRDAPSSVDRSTKKQTDRQIHIFTFL